MVSPLDVLSAGAWGALKELEGPEKACGSLTHFCPTLQSFLYNKEVPKGLKALEGVGSRPQASGIPSSRGSPYPVSIAIGRSKRFKGCSRRGGEQSILSP